MAAREGRLVNKVFSQCNPCGSFLTTHLSTHCCCKGPKHPVTSVQFDALKERMFALLHDVDTHDISFASDDASSEASEVSAHRMIMACLSEPFRALLKGDYCERSKKLIVLHGMSGVAIEQLVRFAYSGCLGDSDRNSLSGCAAAEVVVELLFAADKWQIASLRLECEWLILDKYLSSETAVDLLNVATALSPGGKDFFLSEINQFVAEHAALLFHQEDLVRLTADALKEILKQDALYVKDELEVFQTARKWVVANGSDWSEQRTLMAIFTPYIRLPTIRSRDLCGEVEKSGLVSQEDLYMAFRHQAYPSGLHNAGVTDSRFMPRRLLHGLHLCVPEKIDTLGIHIGRQRKTATNFVDGIRRFYLDRELVTACAGGNSVSWQILVHQTESMCFVGVGCKEDYVDGFLPGLSCGFSSNNELFQAMIEAPQSPACPAFGNRFTCNRVSRLHFGNGCRLLLTFEVTEAWEGSVGDGDSCLQCQRERWRTLRSPHQHGLLSLYIFRPGYLRPVVLTAAIVYINGAKLYPIVALRRPGDCFEVIN